MQPIDVDASEAIEFLNNMQFFGGQSAGRELWADKPKEVQDADLAALNRDIELLRKVVLSKVENTTIEAQPVRHGKWCIHKVDAHVSTFYCSECDRTVQCGNDDFTKPTKLVSKIYPYCHCGAKMDLEEEK